MYQNNDPFNIQNSSNFLFNYPNLNNYQFQNQSPNTSPNMPNYGFAPNFLMPSSVPNYPPYYGSVMPNLSQRPPISSASMGNDVVPNIGTTEFSEFSTQIGLGVTSSVNEDTRKENEEDSTHARRKSPKWTTDQNLVLISGWIKYGTVLLAGTKKVKHIGGKLLSTVMSIAHLILHEMELCAETITTI